MKRKLKKFFGWMLMVPFSLMVLFALGSIIRASPPVSIVLISFALFVLGKRLLSGQENE